MNSATRQLDFFSNQSLNITYEIKRQIRMAMADSTLSRDEIADQMNEIAVKEGLRSGKNGISRAILDSWCRDSDAGRLPSLNWLTIFCEVMGTVSPIGVMLKPLGCGAINPVDIKLLAWAKAEMEKRRAIKKARVALEVLE